MAEPEPETIQTIKATLEPCIKPREQVSYIRRVLALHLQQQTGLDDLQPPLSLLNNRSQVRPKTQLQSQGVYEEYLLAVEENVKARQKFSGLSQQSRKSPPPNATARDAANPIAQHLALIELQKKKEKLLTTQKYLDVLANQSAANQRIFLDPETVFKDSPTLPEVPREVVDGFASSATEGTTSDLSGVLDRMDKVVLRTKLLLRHEEQLLKQVRSRTATITGNVTEQARIQALTTTRNELINWMETELGKASSVNGDEEVVENNDTRPHSQGPGTTGVDVTKQLGEVAEKYKEYVTSRKATLQHLSRQPHPTLEPKFHEPRAAETTDEAPPPVAHLMIPYLDKLLELSRQQKGLIQQKSHLTSVLSKQARETTQALDHLVEESQLLPKHPMGAKEAKGSFGDEMAAAAAAASSNQPESADSVKPWVFAADSAKIADLEAVAEKVEEGQVALERSMRILHDVDQLLGQKPDGPEGDKAEDQTEDDIWLTGEGGIKTGQGKHLERRKPKQTVTDDPWSVLQGNLGLIGQESPAK